MSTLKLEAPIKSYIEAANAQDAGTVARCFTDDGLVTDEGRERRGTAAIRDWAEEVSRKYRPTVEPLSAVAVNGRTVVTGRVSGDFPGSPVDLRYDFSIDGQKITRLEIMP
jgi:ketosteroid isomerase-like protein